jgi:proteasome lid subunit RPN8/RPN11
MRSLTVTNEQLQSMIEYVDSHAPLEACGLLAGRDARVEKIFFVQNQAQSPVRYVMEPVEQLRAFEWIESNKMELLAIFHSHPNGPETVSPTDVAEAAYDVIQMVLSRANNSWKTRAFWIEENSFDEADLQIT